MAYRILVPQPGIEPTSPTLGLWSLNYRATRDVLKIFKISTTNSCLQPQAGTGHLGQQHGLDVGPEASPGLRRSLSNFGEPHITNG